MKPFVSVPLWKDAMFHVTSRKGVLALWLSISFCHFLLTSRAASRERVDLAYPQKVRTFFDLNDTNVPADLRTNAIPPSIGGITASVRAADGATWLGTTQGLLRLDFSAQDRDRRQFLAGLRYL